MGKRYLITGLVLLLSIVSTGGVVCAFSQVTHIEIVNQIANEPGLSKEAQDIIKNHPEYARFGAIAPDMFYMRWYNKFGMPESEWSDRMHYEKTGEMAINLLKIANDEEDPENKARMLAFTYGYIAHIAGDVKGHPYVEKQVGPYGETTYKAHQEEEKNEDKVIREEYKPETDIVEGWLNVAGDMNPIIENMWQQSFADTYDSSGEKYPSHWQFSQASDGAWDALLYLKTYPFDGIPDEAKRQEFLNSFSEAKGMGVTLLSAAQKYTNFRKRGISHEIVVGELKETLKDWNLDTGQEVKDMDQSIILLFDASGSMGDDNKIGYAKIAAKNFLLYMKENDEVALIVFYDCGNIVVEQPFTTDKSDFALAIDSIYPTGNTPLYDSIDFAGEYMKNANGKTKKIILFTDGIETCRS